MCVATSKCRLSQGVPCHWQGGCHRGCHPSQLGCHLHFVLVQPIIPFSMHVPNFFCFAVCWRVCLHAPWEELPAVLSKNILSTFVLLFQYSNIFVATVAIVCLKNCSCQIFFALSNLCCFILNWTKRNLLIGTCSMHARNISQHASDCMLTEWHGWHHSCPRCSWPRYSWPWCSFNCSFPLCTSCLHFWFHHDRSLTWLPPTHCPFAVHVIFLL